ncbi:MAG: DUF4167 domain-containing protein [Paracoccaceae bacterium]
MRSQKSRSRGNKNRSRPTGGNVINRVFDSQGPDGKVRGTPQQIIDKYNQLHRDAQLNGDRVDAENFAQHAEHYTRMLAEAQREVDAKRDEQERQNRERQAERDRDRERDRERNERQRQEAEAKGGDRQDEDAAAEAGPVDVPEAAGEASGQDAQPEAEAPKEKKPRRSRSRRKPAGDPPQEAAE